jgi:hypothetical protein
VAGDNKTTGNKWYLDGGVDKAPGQSLEDSLSSFGGYFSPIIVLSRR